MNLSSTYIIMSTSSKKVRVNFYLVSSIGGATSFAVKHEIITMFLSSKNGTFLVCMILLTLAGSLLAEEFVKENGRSRKTMELLEAAPREILTTSKRSAASLPTKDDDSIDRNERINRNFERMIQLVNVIGQVDNFITDRVRNLIKKLHAVYDVEDSDNPRRTRSHF